MNAELIRVSPDWLELREPADAAARAADLVPHLEAWRGAPGPWVVHDLACGSGSMGRWLAPRLSGPQHWVLHDRDPDLLELAAAHPPEGAGITTEVRRADITRLRPEALAGASLITASALLDLLTAEELGGLIEALHRVGCPVLLTLSVTGRVELTPSEPLDTVLAAAFNAHQRRRTAGGRLLGPAAAAAAATGFRRLGARVVVRPSPWRLGAGDAALVAEWLAGWVGAAREQRPGLARDAEGYARRRLGQALSGSLGVCVHHADLLVLPRIRRGDAP
ncbi:MAG: class I SAM-dependent methyltransferase [Thermoleophilia bacterium]